VSGTASSAPLTNSELAAIPVTRLKGVGERKAEALAEVGVQSVADLLTYYPRRYVDRTAEGRLADLAPGDQATVLVRIEKVSGQRGRGGRSMVYVEVVDDTGRARITFFNQPWRERQLQAGMEAVVFGKLDVFRGRRQFTNPVVDLVGNRTGRIIPVYPQSEKVGLNTWEIGDWIAEALRRTQPRGIADPVPARTLARWQLIGRDRALRDIHEPASHAQREQARVRLVFDELLRIQLALVDRKRQLELTSRGVDHVVELGPGSLVDRFWAGLPFPLTVAQQRVVGEIAEDLGRPYPMHRLLQGDVGAGKTLVALSALLIARQGGFQGALMAPTEVLAEQHFLGLSRMVEGLVVPDESVLGGERPLKVELLTNRTGAADRRRLATELESGAVDIVVGTHALIQDGVAFGRLGLAVIDEQHRFGVEQRAALRDRGLGATVPDVLVMTATPIPRTAAMTVYGDLDVSVLDEMPPGRTPIRTERAVSEDEVADVWRTVRDEVAAGRQAYVVTPLIEESEKIETASAEATFEELRAPGGALADCRVGLLHGRLHPTEKEATFEAFRAHELDVLVATTVIEVGVDVANATVMVILGADRFGLAQLHQLRGRVGRGRHASVCYLVSDQEGESLDARLDAMVATSDGFELAEVDLDLRGEGTLMGERQTGRNDLKLASLRRDREWVQRARDAAVEMVGAGGLAALGELAAEVAEFLGEDATEFLMKD